MSLNISPTLLCDGYKIDHRRQFMPEMVDSLSNGTPRKSRVEGVNEVIVFGPQYYILSTLIDYWNENFFKADIDRICDEFLTEMTEYTLSAELAKSIGVDHWRSLHKLGYMPLEVRSLREGSRCPIGVPFYTVRATDQRFVWLAQFIETDMSAETWGMTTSATNANIFRKLFEYWAVKTGGDLSFVLFQGHDFSYRGMFGRYAAAMSGAGHLLSFNGTDTLPAIKFLKRWYKADTKKDGIIGCSVFATEHAVMMSSTGFYILKDGLSWEYYGEAEFKVFKRLITEVYPEGFVSIVSDTWNLWKVLVEYAKRLNHEILARNGKVIFRPDSGNPVDILCGTETDIVYNDNIDVTQRLNWTRVDLGNGFPAKWLVCKGKVYEISTDTNSISDVKFIETSFNPEQKGVIELLWEIFPGPDTKLGFKTLDPHVGAIYGDSITVDRAWQICKRLFEKKFVSTNWVAGIGSYTYQYVTRDTYGIAIKQTYAEFNIDGKVVGIDLFKNPITDDGSKKSATGITTVLMGDNGKPYLKDRSTWEEFESDANLLRPIFRDGKVLIHDDLSTIRSRVQQLTY